MDKTTLKSTTLFLNVAHMAAIKALGEAQGLRFSQMVRVALAEFIKRHPAV